MTAGCGLFCMFECCQGASFKWNRKWGRIKTIYLNELLCIKNHLIYHIQWMEAYGIQSHFQFSFSNTIWQVLWSAEIPKKLKKNVVTIENTSMQIFYDLLVSKIYFNCCKVGTERPTNIMRDDWEKRIVSDAFTVKHTNTVLSWEICVYMSECIYSTLINLENIYTWA